MGLAGGFPMTTQPSLSRGSPIADGGVLHTGRRAGSHFTGDEWRAVRATWGQLNRLEPVPTGEMNTTAGATLPEQPSCTSRAATILGEHHLAELSDERQQRAAGQDAHRVAHLRAAHHRLEPVPTAEMNTTAARTLPNNHPVHLAPQQSPAPNLAQLSDGRQQKVVGQDAP
jgi:hypothetical protein